MTTPPQIKLLRDKLHTLVSTIGIAASISITGIFVLALIITIKLGSIHSPQSQRLADVSSDQAVLSIQFVSTIDDIDLALRTESWDTIDPSIASFTQQYNHWINTHQDLSAERINRRIKGESGLSVADHFDRVAYNKTQITQSVNELKLVTDSIVRRAPYISQSTQSRMFASAQSIREQFPAYIDSIKQINVLYKSHELQNRKQSIASVQRLCFMLLITLLALPVFVIAPKIRSMQATQQSLEAKLVDAQTEACHRWSLLASLAQEIRKPMNTIIERASRILNAQHDDVTNAEHELHIEAASNGLNTLIDDILQISSINADTFTINPKTIDLRALFNSIENRYQSIASDKGLTLKVQLDESCPTSITTDEQHLNHILKKLIDNAIQYTKAGSVNIQASLEQTNLQDTTQDKLTIRIVDTGIGINHEHIPRIFDAFHRIEESESNTQDHHGLGLTIAQALAKQLGGDIAIESASGAGCFATVTIHPGQYSFATTSNPIDQSSNADHAILVSKRLLIADDHEDIQQLLTRFLTRAGCSIELAADGQLAVDQVLSANQSEAPFDLILMDMQMPVLDGYQATQRIRQSGISTPIIGITAHSSDDDIARCLQAGCDTHLPKPISKSELLNECAKQLHQNAQNNTKDAA